MSYSVDKDKAYEAAKVSLASIEESRQNELEAAIQRDVAYSEKWHRRVPFLFKKLTREQALERLKGSDEYWIITKIRSGRQEEALRNIIKACENTSEKTVHIGEKDFYYLPL